MIVNKQELLRSRTCIRARKLALGAIETALVAADAKVSVKTHVKMKGKTLQIKKERFSLDGLDSIYVIGAGKASGHMAEALFNILDDRIAGGLVIVPDYLDAKLNTGKIQLWKASHPIPSYRGVKGVMRMLTLVHNATKRDLVICLISGGGSALMPLPYENLTIKEKQRITSILLKSGATIQEVNCVRKHLSAIKGGRLAEHLQNAKTVSLIISDVVGDRLDTIASGPTVPDITTFNDAMHVLKKYNLWQRLDRNVKCVIEMGLSGKIAETPKPGSKVLRNTRNFVIANNKLTCEASMNYLKARGINTTVLTTFLRGEASEVGIVVSSIASEINFRDKPVRKPAAVIMGGETTVAVKGRGKGGRNQELVLSASKGISEFGNTVIISIGTDGIDGNSNAAGAIADSSTFKRASKMKLDSDQFLQNNNSNTFFRKLGDTIQTGSTGTNVNDVLILICL
ncbi:MAG: glycerate kinase [Nitrososphaerales archaeon]